MKSKIIFFSVLAFIFTGSVTNVSGFSPVPTIDSQIRAFRYYKDVENVSTPVPAVVEVGFSDDFIERFDFAVLDKDTNIFEPYYFRQEILTTDIPVAVSTIPTIASAMLMTDRNISTYSDFILPENTLGQVQINLASPVPIKSSALTMLLDENVALPTTIEIRAMVDGQSRIVLARQKMSSITTFFPEIVSDLWTISLMYGQPLRISELSLIQKNAVNTADRAVRFLAQPGQNYRIYFDPDRQANIHVGESGDLASVKDVVQIRGLLPVSNPSYRIADVDNDNIPDIQDNCISVPNPDQKDLNGNGRGDTCDDFDQDAITNSKDNCPDNPNRDQTDTDGDGKGDVCDGAESRITERYPWIPWLGIGFAALVLVSLFALTAKSFRNPGANKE